MDDNKKPTSGMMFEQGLNHLTASKSYTDYEAVNPWIVPRTTSPLYTGRGEIGERLARVFSFDLSRPSTKRRTFAIIGLGGAGKSEICLKFAEDYRDEYVTFNIFPISR